MSSTHTTAPGPKAPCKCYAFVFAGLQLLQPCLYLSTAPVDPRPLPAGWSRGLTLHPPSSSRPAQQPLGCISPWLTLLGLVCVLTPWLDLRPSHHHKLPGHLGSPHLSYHLLACLAQVPQHWALADAASAPLVVIVCP